MWMNNAYAQDEPAEMTELTEVPADGTPQSGGGPQGGLGSMLPMLLIFIAVMYFFMLRPQQKKEKQRREMLSQLSKGDRVMTQGGIYGTIVGLNEKSVVLRVSEEPPIKMEFARGAVSVVSQEEELSN